jgi:hypothetical protein
MLRNIIGKIVNWTKAIAAFFVALRGGKLWPLAQAKFEGLIIWAVVFVVAEIIISGGRHPGNIYLLATSLIIILFISLYSSVKRPVKDIKKSLLRGLLAALVFAILDFLVINLLLEKNNLQIYRSWQSYVQYALVFLVPVVASRFGKERFGEPQDLEQAVSRLPS